MAAVAAIAFQISLASYSQAQTAPRPVIEIVADADGRVISRTGPEGATPGSRYPDTDPFIVAARRSAADFTVRLPDFICEQQTTRKESGWGPIRWRAYDRVTAEVLYVDGVESYRNVRVNGKAASANDPEVTGTWSTGEYGTILKDVLSVSTGAVFEHPRDTRIDGIAAKSYSYKVAQPNSHWRVSYEGFKLTPAFEGSVWFDPRDHRVLRMEMIARDIPAEFPLDIIETTVDYGLVEIGHGRYLLPVVAECLACVRNSKKCSRNEIRFRKYRKFSAESVLTTTDSTIPFDGARGR